MATPDPAAYESLERRLDTVLGSADAGTLKIVLASLATKDDLRDEVTGLRHEFAAVNHDLGLVVLDLADFKKDVRHEFALVRKDIALVGERSHQDINRLIKWMVPTIFGGITAMGAVVALAG